MSDFTFSDQPPEIETEGRIQLLLERVSVNLQNLKRLTLAETLADFRCCEIYKAKTS